jgi:hypothetical protein
MRQDYPADQNDRGTQIMAGIENGRATVRDVWSLQNEMNDELKEIRSEIANLKIRVYLNAAAIGLAVTILTNYMMQHIKF